MSPTALRKSRQPVLALAAAVSGIALNPPADTTSGVSRVDFFLGPRDSGGMIIGSAIPANTVMGPGRFQITRVPDANRGDTLIAYAYSAISGATTSLAVPIQIGPIAKPESSSGATPTPVPASVTVKSSCPTASLTSSGIAVTRSTAPVVMVIPAEGPNLQLANPNAEDILPRGTYLVSGVAFDSASTQGPGVDQVEFFLDSRDSGGLHLGTAVPGLAGGRPGAFVARLSIPSTANGGHNFVAYARSAISGQESAVSVPVFIGAPPSPTPHS